MPPGTRPPGVPARALRRPLRLCGTPVPATAHAQDEQRGPDRCERQDPDPRETVRVGRVRLLAGGVRRWGRLGEADPDADRLRALRADLRLVPNAQLCRPRALVRERDVAVA